MTRPWWATLLSIAQGSAGRCGVIVSEGGCLRSLAYGQPVLLHPDPVERKPLYHVQPGARLLSLGTAGCNLRCAFCQNWRLSQSAPSRSGNGYAMPPDAVVAAAREQGCAGVAFTYNEPTVGLDYAAEVMQAAKRAGLLTALKTNGYLTPDAIDALDGLLDAVNVDLKGFRDAFYREVCGARLAPVREAIAHLHRRGVWVEVTTPIIPGSSDSDAELGALAAFLSSLSVDIPWHVWRFHPDYRMRITTLDAEKWDATEVLRLYQARWQVELVFKRMKQVLKMNTIRCVNAERVEATVRAFLVAWLLHEQEASWWARRTLKRAHAVDMQVDQVDDEQIISSWALTALYLDTLRTQVRGT